MMEFFKERLGEERANQILEESVGKTYEEILDERDELEAHCEFLAKRLGHLLESKTVKLYDNVSGKTGEYIRDIRDLDKHTYETRWEALKRKATFYLHTHGSYEDGRYCVAISVNDLLEWMEELENSNETTN